MTDCCLLPSSQTTTTIAAREGQGERSDSTAFLPYFFFSGFSTVLLYGYLYHWTRRSRSLIGAIIADNNNNNNKSSVQQQQEPWMPLIQRKTWESYLTFLRLPWKHWRCLLFITCCFSSWSSFSWMMGQFAATLLLPCSYGTTATTTTTSDGCDDDDEGHATEDTTKVNGNGNNEMRQNSLLQLSSPFDDSCSWELSTTTTTLQRYFSSCCWAFYKQNNCVYLMTTSITSQWGWLVLLTCPSGYCRTILLFPFLADAAISKTYNNNNNNLLSSSDGAIVGDNDDDDAVYMAMGSKKCSSSIVATNTTSTTSTTTSTRVYIPLQYIWENNHVFLMSIMSRWGWLLFLPCQSSLSWTVGPFLSIFGLSSSSYRPNHNNNMFHPWWYCLNSEKKKNGIGKDDDRQQQKPTTNTANKPQYLEILIHNVSQNDMILSLDVPPQQSSMDTATSTFCVLDHPQDKVEALIDDSHGNEADATPATATNILGNDEFCLCRPRFSAFANVSSRIVKALLLLLADPPPSSEDSMLIHVDRCERIHNDVEDTGATTAPSETPCATRTMTTLPTGLRLDVDDPNLMIPQEQWSDLHICERDVHRVEHCPLPGLPLNAVFFPIVSLLVAQWQERLAKKYNHMNDDDSIVQNSTTTSSCSAQRHVKKVLFLVSGVGTPNHVAHDDDIHDGNSTSILGILLEHFVQMLYPDIVVVRIDSESTTTTTTRRRNLFRYDESIAFVKDELMPRLLAYQHAHALGLPYPDEVDTNSTDRSMGVFSSSSSYWSSSSSSSPSPNTSMAAMMTISCADGSLARTLATIHAVSSSYWQHGTTATMTILHVWQLDSFWYLGKLVDDDVEVVDCSSLLLEENEHDEREQI